MHAFVLAVMVVYLTLGILATVFQVGKPREPLSNGMSVWIVILNAAFIAGLFYIYRI